jgi:riboflavin biosynthesis pyrimidine reductase
MRGYSSEMAVIASFVLGSNGASSLYGQSRGLSTPADRDRFLARHHGAAAFTIGKKSAALENYGKTSVPIFVYSRSSEVLHFPHPFMQQITVDRNLKEITQLIDLRIDGPIVVEAGYGLLLPMIREGVIDILELSITPIAGDGDFVDQELLLSYFEITSDIDIDGTRLLECRYKSNSGNGESNS